MLNALTKVLSKKRNTGDHKDHKEGVQRDSQNLWQKATSLRQSLRNKSKSNNKEAKSARLHRHWSSQRNLTRERKSYCSNPAGSDVTPKEFGRKQARSYTDGGDTNEWEVAKRLFDMSTATKNGGGGQRHSRSPRKLTKDSGYETSAQGDQDYGSIEWTNVPSTDRNRYHNESRKSETLELKCQDGSCRNSLSKDNNEVLLATKYLSRYSSTDSVSSWGQVTSAKSAPILSIPLGESPPPPYSPISLGSLYSQEDMVTRRFKKGSVYGTLASNSGLDFAPVLHSRSYWDNSENATYIQSETQLNKPIENDSNANTTYWKKEIIESPSATLVKKPIKADYIDESTKKLPQEATIVVPSSNSAIQENPTTDIKVTTKRSGSSHEKYPSWPVTVSGNLSTTVTTTSSQRSHSWTAQTEYPKETVSYSRPQKSYKILTSQLQPVLERPDNKKKTFREKEYDHTMNTKLKDDIIANEMIRPAMCIPHCQMERGSDIHSPPERDITLITAKEKEKTDLPASYLNKYDDFLRHYAQHLSPPSTGSSSSGYGCWTKDTCTPFLDRLRLESATLPLTNDASSEVSTWIGSADANLKWHGAGSYSDLSNFSVQMSNRSSLFDSGHSTMPDSGRLSPQSSCSGSILLSRIETSPTRAQVISRHGCHRESIAHSSKVQQPQRHDSESVVYYASQKDGKQTSHTSHKTDAKCCSHSNKEDNFKHSSSRIENNELLEGNILKLRQFCSELKIYTSSSSEQKVVRCSNYGNPNKLSYLDPEKKQSLTDPELKAIQKQAVLSFFQRQTEKSAECKMKEEGCQRRNSLPPAKWNERCKNPVYQEKQSNKSIQIEKTLANLRKNYEYKNMGHHSKSVPNLCELKRPHGNAAQSASQSSIRHLSRLQLEGKVASLATIFDGPSTEKEISDECKEAPKVGNCKTSATSYFRSHRSPRKVQLKEVHQADELSKIKVFNSEGITLIDSTERNIKQEENIHSEPPQVPPRRIQKNPAPPPVRQPPSRPPPPPPPTEPELLEENHNPEIEEALKTSLLQNGNVNYTHCPSPELPLPPPPSTDAELCVPDEPLPPPPDLTDVEMSGRPLGQNTLVYPKNSYMSYRSEKKISRSGFDGNYHRISPTPSFSQEHNSQSPQREEMSSTISPTSWEQLHNIRQHGPTVIFHSDSIRGQQNSQRWKDSSNNSTGYSHENTIANGKENSPTSVCANNSDKEQIQTSVYCESVHNSSVESSGESSLQSILNTENTHHRSSISGISSPSKSEENVHKHLLQQEETQKKFSNESSSNIDKTEVTRCSSNSDFSLNSPQNEKANSECQTESKTETIVQNVPVQLVPRTNSATQTTDTPSLRRKAKTREELECEQLSRDFIDHCPDRVLKNLLVPAPNQKTMSDYMEGLLDLELESGGHPMHRLVSDKINLPSAENCQRKENPELLLASAYYTTSEPKAKLLTRYNKTMDVPEWNNETELNRKKEELVAGIARKLNILRTEQVAIREEMSQNDALGRDITGRVEQLVKPNELEKYKIHVEELDKIISLLLSLSGRLARAQNALMNLPEEVSHEEKKFLEAKRDKLIEQHEDARRLKESIDRRSQQVSTFLHQYLTEEEYADYDHFIKMKSKLLMDAREIEDKIKLGEEQLATLCNDIDWLTWKHNAS